LRRHPVGRIVGPDHIEPRAGGAGRDRDPVEEVLLQLAHAGGQRRHGVAPRRRQGGGDDHHRHRLVLHAEGFDEAGQRFERAPGAAGHLRSRFVRRRLSGQLRQREMEPREVVRHRHLDRAEGQTEKSDPIGGAEAGDQSVHRLPQRGFPSRAQRVFVDGEHHRAARPRRRVGAERRRQFGGAGGRARGLRQRHQLQRSDGALAAADPHLHVGGLQILDRRAVRRDDGELQREEIRAALGRFLLRRRSGRKHEPGNREQRPQVPRGAGERS
jgi:hypothetical protein